MKEFECPKCKGKVFTIVYHHYTVVDFSREGAIEGHPFLQGGSESFDSIFCNNCAEPVEGDMEREILREVI